MSNINILRKDFIRASKGIVVYAAIVAHYGNIAYKEKRIVEIG